MQTEDGEECYYVYIFCLWASDVDVKRVDIKFDFDFVNPDIFAFVKIWERLLI